MTRLLGNVLEMELLVNFRSGLNSEQRFPTKEHQMHPKDLDLDSMSAEEAKNNVAIQVLRKRPIQHSKPWFDVECAVALEAMKEARGKCLQENSRSSTRAAYVF